MASRLFCTIFEEDSHGPPIERPASVAGCVRRRCRTGDRRCPPLRSPPAWSAASSRTTTGKPVEGAKITIDVHDANNRHFDAKSDKKGEFLQIGLRPGAYKVTAEKDKVDRRAERR